MDMRGSRIKDLDLDQEVGEENSPGRNSIPPPPGNEKGKDKEHLKMNENEEDRIPPSADSDSISTLTLTVGKESSSVIPSAEGSDPKIPRPEEPEGDEEEDKFVPSVEYSPLIPLPPLVHLQNPHEDEDSIFQGRAKLFSFDNSKKAEDGSGLRIGMWVERGLGVIKILQDKAKGNSHRVRLVMWRENVNTIACNHWVASIGSLTERPDRVLLWSALDFAFDCPRVELFSCKFPSTESCKEFKGQLNRLIASIPPMLESPGASSSSSSEDVEKLLRPLSDLFARPKEGSWVCKGCFLSNGPHSQRCPACEHEQESTETETGQNGDTDNSTTTETRNSTIHNIQQQSN